MSTSSRPRYAALRARGLLAIAQVKEPVLLCAQLSENFLFASVSASDIQLAINTMVPETVAAGTMVINQGDSGDRFYVIEQGVCLAPIGHMTFS